MIMHFIRQSFQSFIDFVAPTLSIRRQFLQLSAQAPEVLRTEGAGAVIRGARRAIARYRQTGALIIPTVAPAPEPLLPPYSYREWIEDNEPSPQELEEQRQRATALGYHPVISIIVPVYNPPPDILSAAIDSVLAQTYQRWTLCLANGDSANQQIRSLLERYAVQDERILVAHLDANLGISGNSNAALQLATGEFVALMDHDDLLAPNLLFEVVSLLNGQPDADIIYFDEDKLSVDGTREQPWFKPQFSPDLMLSTNLLMHSVFRRTLVQSVGGFSQDTNGAQDWDLALRCSLQTTAICHIPKVLYHWRMIAGSAALDANAKPWAATAQARAVERHILEADGTVVKVDFPAVGRVRVIWPERGVKISIIIPTKDRLPLLRACLHSVFAQTTYPHYEVILVDTGSKDDETFRYYEALCEERDVTVVEDRGSFNYSRANNVGAAAASGELFLFLNNDTEVLSPDWLNEMAGWAQRPHVGIVGAKLLRPNGLIQHAGIIMGLAGHGSHVFEDMPEDDYGIFGSTEWIRDYQAVTGACMLVRRDLFRQLCGFDEVYQVGYSDIDLCLRAGQAGYRVVFTPFARLLHHEGGSRGYYLPASDVLRASCQMLPLVQQADPYFNPNLSITERKPALARPHSRTSQQTIHQILHAYGLVPAAAVDEPECMEWELGRPVAWPEASAPGPTLPDRSLESLSLLLLSHDLSLSGAPLILARLAIQLVQRGARITVLSAADGPIRAIYEDADIPVRVDASLGEPIDNVAPITRMVNDFDLVLANTIVSWPGIHAAKAHNKVSILWLHESHYGYDRAVSNPGVASAIRSADLVLLPSRHLAELYREFLPADRYAVLPYGLNPRDIESGGFDIQPDSDRVLILSVGSLEPRKGQDFLLSAFRLLPQRTREACTLEILGRTIAPEFAAALHQKAGDNVRFAGEMGHADTMAHLAKADIFVLPSRDEVLPISLLEAMYHGTAIVAADVGGVTEAITDEQSGLVVKFGDEMALANALQRLIEDRALRERLGRNARREFSERFTMDIFANGVVDLLRQTIGRRYELN